jgi:hypothetical protein
MTSPQANRILAILNEHDRSAPVAPWLARLESVFTEPTLDQDSMRALIDRGRPRWGVRSDEDAIAYLAFWSRLVARYDEPRLQAARADVVYLLGGPSRSCEALAIFLAAVARDPEVFVEYSGNFVEAAKECGRAQQVDFEVAKIRFYAALVDRGEMDDVELRDAVRDILATYGDDPELRSRLRAIAHGL